MLTNAELRACEAHVEMCRDVCNHLEKKDWEQRRYEIAKELYSKLSNDNLTHHQAAELAVVRADALIEVLKKKR